MGCKRCGEKLGGQATVFCSKRCRDRWRWEVPSKIFTCSGCGRTLLIPANKMSRQKFCSRSCAYKHRRIVSLRGPRNGRWRGGKVLSYGTNWNQVKAKIRERDRVCKNCGKTPEQNGRALDVHHIDPYRFSGNNDPDNLIALCRSCHMRAIDIGLRGLARFAGPKQLELRLPTRIELQRRRGEELRRRRHALQQKAFGLRELGRSLRQSRELGVSHQAIANWLRAAGGGDSASSLAS